MDLWLQEGPHALLVVEDLVDGPEHQQFHGDAHVILHVDAPEPGLGQSFQSFEGNDYWSAIS